MLRRFPLRIQITAIIAMSCAIALISSFGIFLWQELGFFQEQEIDEMRTQTVIVGNNSSAALAFGDAKVAAETLALFRLQPHVDHAALFMKDGTLLASYSRVGVVTPSPSAAPNSSYSRVVKDRLDTSDFIALDGERVGSIIVSANLGEWKERREGHISLMGLITLLSIAIAALIGSRFQKVISEPIRKLSLTLESVAETKDYRLRTDVDGSHDEIGHLVVGFNSMLSEIQERDEALQSANEELEVRVLERTKQLNAEVIERQTKEAELVVSQAQLSNFFETAPFGIAWLDSDLRIVAANKAELEIFGYGSDDFVGRPIADFHGECEDFGVMAEQLVKGETIWNRECVIHDKSGARKFVEINASAQLVEGQFVSAGFFTRDVTMIKKSEEVEHARERAERANQAKTEFLSRISHELRTPMNSILGFGQLLEMEELEPRPRECVEQILKGGRHLLNLINEVLNISRIETGNLSLSIEPVSLEIAFGETVDLMRPMAAQKGIDIQVDLGENTAMAVLADRQRLNQVLLNMLSNAVKYNKKGGSIRCGVELNDADRVRIFIEDTGPGITEENAQRLFVPFDRLGAEQSGVEGTGLGLPLSKSLIEAMGGKLELDLAYRNGCRFTIKLPRATEVHQSGPLAAPLAVSAFGMTKPRTVLLIEDNLANVKLIEQLLSARPGVRLLVAMQGRLGFDFAREHRPDLILLDVNLPDVSGIDVAVKLKNDAALANTPLIVISADVTKAIRDRLQKIGVHTFLPKPLDVRVFMDLVDRLLCDEVELSA